MPVGPPARTGAGIMIGRLLETVRVADAAMQEIQRKEKHPQSHGLIHMRPFVAADAHALIAAECGAVVSERRLVEGLAGMQDDLTEGERTLAEESETRKDQSAVRNGDARTEQQGTGTQSQAERGHRQRPQASENEKSTLFPAGIHVASVHKTDAHEKAGRSPLFPETEPLIRRRLRPALSSIGGYGPACRLPAPSLSRYRLP